MPGCAVDPHTHNHRRHPIGIYHTPRDACSNDDCLIEHHEPVTVADLLDLRDAAEADGDESVRWDRLGDLFDRAPDDAKASFGLIFLALEGDIPVADLSPEERAEFDRRTT